MTRRLLDARDAALTTAIGGAIALLAAHTKSFWGDEIRSLEFATMSVGRALAEIAADCHPPAYFLLLRLWVGVFGTSELALRLFQGLQASALLLAALALFRKLMPERRFHPFWLLLALASELWLCAPMLRYYALAATLALLATLAFTAWLERPSSGRSLSLGALYALLLYTDYPASFVAVMHLAWIAARRPELLVRFVAIGAAAAAPFLPWLEITIRQIRALQAVERVADLNASPLAVPVKIAYSAYAFAVGEMTYPFEPIAIVGVLSLLAAVAVAARELGRRRGGPPLAMLAAGVAGLCFTAVITSFIAKRMSFILTPTRTLYCLPVFYLAFGLAWSRLESRAARALLVAPFLLLALYGDLNWVLSRHFLMPVYATPWKDVVASLRGESGGLVADQLACYRYYSDRMRGDYPVILRTETTEALQADLALLPAVDGAVSVFSIELGRESTDSQVKSAVTEYLAAHGALESERKFLPIDPSYRAFKARISKRDTYDAKVTVRRYRLPLAPG
ncbi:MAG TPA: hypothetical protein VEN47_00365 [Myxococcota bacterium]|nr:hypothetical protein [Myxococcota bacterium]